MVASVRLGRIWNWLTGRGRPGPEPEPPPASKPGLAPSQAGQGAALAPTTVPPPPLTFEDPQVEALARPLARQLPGYRVDHFLRQAAGLKLAGSQTGLPGLALQLVALGQDQSDQSALALASLRELKGLDPPGPWDFGLKLTDKVRYPAQKLAIAQATLASRAASSATGLAGLGLECARAIDARYYGEDRCAVLRATLKEVESSSPAASLALELDRALRYDSHRTPIFELCLENLQVQTAPELAELGARVAALVDSRYYMEDCMALERTVVARLQADPATAEAMTLGTDLCRVLRYDSQRKPVLDAALASCQTSDPMALLCLGRDMLQGVDARYYGEDALAGRRLLLDRMTRVPATATMATLGQELLNSCRYDSHRITVADTILDALQAGETSELRVGQRVLAAFDPRYYAEDWVASARLLLRRCQDPDAQVVLQAMDACPYDAHRVEMARVGFRHLAEVQRPTLPQLALQLLQVYDARYYATQAMATGRALADLVGERYSAARGRLDTILRSPASDIEKLQALKATFEEVARMEDDAAAIRRMAGNITGKAPGSAVEERDDAVIVGGVRLKVRPEDSREAKERDPEPSGVLPAAVAGAVVGAAAGALLGFAAPVQ